MPAFGTTVFCDELRFEASGKFMLIGCYGDTLLLNRGFPSRLPSLHFHIQLYVPRSEQGPFRIQIFMPQDRDKPSMEADVPAPPDPTPDELEDRPEPDDEPQFRLALNVAARDIELASPGFIKVRCVLGDSVIRLGDLRVAAAEEPPEGRPRGG